MHIEVRYLSQTGNTRKLAEAIAQEAETVARPITYPLAEADILFLGGAVHWGGVDKELKKFIQGLDGRVKKVAVFSTAAFMQSAYPTLKKLLEAQKLTVTAYEFHCRGKFLLFHRDRPNAGDLELARKFAREIIKES
jgi:flavodoxin